MFITNQEAIIRLLVSLILGAVIGLERKKKERGLGMRTASLISLTACLFTVSALNPESPTNIARIAQGLMTGVGFIGAALIWKERMKKGVYPHRLTTAVTVLVLTSIGFVIGVGLYLVGIVATLLTTFILFVGKLGVE